MTYYLYYRCRTYDSYIWLLERLREKGCRWAFTTSLKTDKNVWTNCGENTVIKVNGKDKTVSYGNYDLYIQYKEISEEPKNYCEVVDMMKKETATKPSYYTGSDGKDLFDRFENGLLTREETVGFYKADIIKYLTRYADKNGIEDLKKARVYLNRLIKFEELAKNDDILGIF